MAISAQGHKVFDLVFLLRATHPPAVDMMYINSSGATDFARNEVFRSIVEKREVGFYVLLQS